LARKNKNKTTINYHLIAVNVGIIGSLFIFFIIALEVPASTILGVHTKTQHTIMVGAVLIMPFSISFVQVPIDFFIE